MLNHWILRQLHLVDCPEMLFKMGNLLERTIADPTSILSFVLVHM